MAGRDLIVVGASAGGVEALQTLVGGLPEDLAASVCVVMHMPPEGPGMLPVILSRAGPLTARHPRDGESLQRGRIYVAPPDYHLLVEGTKLRLERGPRENRHRPAVDPLFRSAARELGPRVIGVILTGNLDDGTAGLRAIKKRGGLAVVQHPEDALFPGMPRSALMSVTADHVVPLREMAGLLSRLTARPAPETVAAGDVPDIDVDVDPKKVTDMDTIGKPSAYACPDCNGVLWELDDKHLLRFRCRVGHAYTAETLLADQDEHVEDALWAAVRSLEENAALANRVATRLKEAGNEIVARRMEKRALVNAKHADHLRRILEETEKTAEEA